MKVTILGCGSSGGVPLIGSVWGSCDPANPKNRRMRPSILVEDGDSVILVDTGADLREQLLMADVNYLTGVIYTHAHADHVHGIDDLRAINWKTNKPIDIYGDSATMAEITHRFDYIFDRPSHNKDANSVYKPSLIPHIIENDLDFGKVAVKPFWQTHGRVKSVGFRFGDFAYSTDVNEFNEEAFDALKGIAVWVVDCISDFEGTHPTHATLTQTLAWIDRVRPQRVYLTHMSHHMDYEIICNRLPKNVVPAYDGLVIEV